MRISFIVLALCSFLMFPSVTEAQSLKIGYVNVDKLYAQWPEIKIVNKELQEYETNLSARLRAKVQDYQSKLKAFQKNVATMNASSRQDSEAELANVRTQIQQFEANAKQSIQERRMSLVQPLQSKLKQTIDEVAEKNGFSHVFTEGSSLIYSSDSQGDLSSRVAKSLGFSYNDN